MDVDRGHVSIYHRRAVALAVAIAAVLAAVVQPADGSKPAFASSNYATNDLVDAPSGYWRLDE